MAIIALNQYEPSLLSATYCQGNHYTNLEISYQLIDMYTIYADVATYQLIKGNNKITELRTILQRESQNS